MIFAIDEQTRRLVASVPHGSGAEQFDCVADTCRNPACRCLTVTVAFHARALDQAAQPALARKVSVDIGAGTLDDAFKKAASSSDIAFAETVLAAMGTADFDLLGRIHFMIKQRETEQTNPADIKASFDFDEIERSSMMQTYNDILPYAETMQVVIDGREYVVLDQYCVKTRCGCKDAHLNLLPIKEAGGVLETSRSVNVNYDTRTWEPVPDEPLPCGVATFRKLLEGDVSDLYAKLRTRHERLCAIYAHARKRERSAVAPSFARVSAGRNDPCPCGSAKKFKTCCVGKQPSSGDARRIQSTITIRR